MDAPLLRRIAPGLPVARADHVNVLVDADAYFRAFAQAAAQARHSLLILAWDINSRIRLVPDDSLAPLPATLGPFLEGLLAREPQLHIRLLLWDYSFIYLAEREALPALRFGRTHRRLHFALDDRLPAGASHHQKIVVVDDAVAFVGGFDLTRDRWDTPAHLPIDTRRRRPDGSLYGPFHDIQVRVDGDAAAALGDLARRRWARATGETLEPPPRRSLSLPAAEADFEDIPAAIAVTAPAFRNETAVQDVLDVHAGAFREARRALYIENQYLTSRLVGDLLAELLQRDDGPDIVIVTPLQLAGRLEEDTMGVLRARLFRRLRAADRHGQLRILCPLPAGGSTAGVMVHSKLFLADDRLLKIGSSNLSNRSMGYDTECDLVFEARSDAHREAFTALRRRLLAEHLGTTAAEVIRAETESPGLAAAVDTLRARHPGRLVEFDAGSVDFLDRLLPDSAIIDPEQALNPERLIATLRKGEIQADSTLIPPIIWVAATLLGLTALWEWGPLEGVAKAEVLEQALLEVRQWPFSTAVALAGFTVAASLAVPVTVLVVAVGVTFPPLSAVPVTLGGAVLSAAVTWGAGRAIGERLVQGWAGPRVERVRAWLRGRGVLSIALLRNIPIAPFAVVNVVAGSVPVRFGNYLLGTVVGMAPGILAGSFLGNRLLHVFRLPRAADVAAVVGIGAVLGAVGWYLRTRINSLADALAEVQPPPPGDLRPAEGAEPRAAE